MRKVLSADDAIERIQRAVDRGAKLHVSKNLREAMTVPPGAIPVPAFDRPIPPAELDAVVDRVLAYRPKPKTKPAKKRKRRATTYANAKLERSSATCYSIVDGGTLLGFAMRLENGLWGMFRPNLTRLTQIGYLTARHVCVAFRTRKPEARLS